MTDTTSDAPFGDPSTAYFWESAQRGELAIQRCQDCLAHQFYPRPFCLTCDSERVEWVKAAGTGTIYSLTTVRIATMPDLVPPYVVVLVDLDEGPRLVGNLADDRPARIGDRVRVAWRARDDMPPLPIFQAEP